MKIPLKYKEIKKKQDELYDLDKKYLYNEHSGGSSIMPIKETEVKPSWFKAFEKKNDKRWEKQEQFNSEVFKFMQRQDKRWEKQEEFNKVIINRLDNVESKVDIVAQRLENVIVKNNLAE